MRSVQQKVFLVAVGVVGLAGFPATSASAAPPSRPAITITSGPSEGATVTSSRVAFAFTYNRTPKQTRKLNCTLSGPTPSSTACDPPTAFGTSRSSSGKSYTGLANGRYTFSVSLTLTDKGTAS